MKRIVLGSLALAGLAACQTTPYAVATPEACMALDRWIGARAGDEPVTFDSKASDATMAKTRLRTELGGARGYPLFAQLETCLTSRTGSHDYERAPQPISVSRERGGVSVRLDWDPVREATTITLNDI